MAVPKKKVSRSRRNMRRFSAAYELESPTYTTCPECNETVRTHRVCSNGHRFSNKKKSTSTQATAR